MSAKTKTPAKTTTAAPLAQLREKDSLSWRAIMSQGHPATSPQIATLAQSLAASLLGDRDLAQQILSDGFYSMHERSIHWPDLR